MILEGDGNKVEQFKVDWATLPREELLKKYKRSWSTMRSWVCELNCAGLRPKSGIRRSVNERQFELPSFDDLINLAIREKDLVGGYFHQGVLVEKEIDTSLPIAVTFTADWHLGSFGVDYESFEKDMKMIRDVEGLYAYVGGDSEQNIVNTNFAVRFEQQVPFRQKALFIRTMEMIKDKVIALGTGNHNDWSKAADGVDQIAEIARSLNIVYTQNGGMLELFVGNVLYRIFRVHKSRFHSTLNLTHCLTSDSIVHTLNGDKKISDVVVGDEVYSCDGKSLRLGRVKWSGLVGNKKPILRVSFDTGDSLNMTPNCPVMLRDGSYKNAEDLSIGDSVMPFNRQYSDKGYPLIYSNIDRGLIGAHKWVFKEVTGRSVLSGCVLHHKDYNKENASSWNIEEMFKSSHDSLHTEVHAEIMSKLWKDSTYRERVGKKISEVLTGKKRSEDSKRHQRETLALPENKKRRSKLSKEMHLMGIIKPFPITLDIVKKREQTKRSRLQDRDTSYLLDPEYHRKLSAAKTGENHPMFGKHHSEESKKKMSDSKKRKILINHKVVSILFIGYEDVYDLEVEDLHNFAVNGIFVHNTVKRLWEFAPDDFDIGVVEHKHLAAIEPFDRHGKEKWAIRTGTYLVQDDFARSNGMYGLKVANPTVILYPDHKKIIGFFHMEDAIKLLKSERKRITDEKPKIIQATIVGERKRPELVISED